MHKKIEELESWGSGTKRITFFCDEDLVKPAIEEFCKKNEIEEHLLVSHVVYSLEYDYEANISWLGADMWMGFGLKFQDEDLPDIRVECDFLEYAFIKLLEFLEDAQKDN